jgi:predicted oxidoreductase
LREVVAAVTVKPSAENWYRVWQASVGHEVA